MTLLIFFIGNWDEGADNFCTQLRTHTLQQVRDLDVLASRDYD